MQIIFFPEEIEMEEDIYCKNNLILQYKTILNQIKMDYRKLSHSSVSSSIIINFFYGIKSKLIKKSWITLYQ